MSLPAGFDGAPDLLAFGGELKATFCVVKDGAAILSQHQGDLEDVSTFEDYQKNLQLYSKIYDHRPRMLVADMHPEYLSAKLAKQRSTDDKLPLLEVQHHHAHIASCMVENGIALDAPPVLGIAIDGLGFGGDGTIWGGEFLLADYRSYRRVAAFKPVAMVGGVQAIREPWRTYAHLVAAQGWAQFVENFSTLDLYRYLSAKPLKTIDRMLETGLNVPLASSCGRLFDAVAAALGLCADHALFEGQGAMELEALAENGRCRLTSSRTPSRSTNATACSTSNRYHVARPAGDLGRQTPLAQMALSSRTRNGDSRHGRTHPRHAMGQLAEHSRSQRRLFPEQAPVRRSRAVTRVQMVYVVSYTPKSQATTEDWRWVRLLLRQRVISTNEEKQRLGIPGQIIKITNAEKQMALVDVSGVQREISLSVWLTNIIHSKNVSATGRWSMSASA